MRLSASLILLSLAGCPAEPAGPRYVGAGHSERRAGGTFVFSEISDIRSLDPHIAYDSPSLTQIRLLFDGLYDYDLDSRIVPRLATSLPEISEDGRTFTVELRRGVRFHHGREMIAEDVRWSLEHMLDRDTGSPGATFFLALVGGSEFHEGRTGHVEGIEVLDRYRLRFRLLEADQTFLNALAMAFAYPVPHEMYADGSMAAALHPIGTGPYRLGRWERGVQLEYELFAGYWDPIPRPSRMICLEQIEEDVATPRFRNGDLDVLHLIGRSPVDFLFFQESEAWQPFTIVYPAVLINGLALNTEMEPFDDVHVRRAIALSIDRERWSRALNRQVSPAGQVLPPAIPGYDANLPTLQRFDLDEARREMRLAGYADGLPEPIEVVVTTLPNRSAELLQVDLAKIGIEVRLKPMSFATYIQESGTRGRLAAFFSAWSMDFPDASNFLDILFHTRSIRPVNAENRSFYSNPELDRILDEARSDRDPEHRVALYRRANEIVARDAPWVFLYYRLEGEAHQPYVRGYTPHPVWNDNYRDVWLDLPRRRDDPGGRP